MRITHNILISNFLRNLNAISERLEISQQQLATGSKYNRPSQGPIEVGQVIGFRSSLAHIGQYLKNVDDGSSQVGYIDSVVQSMIDDVVRARDLALDGANDNLNMADRRVIGQEINLLAEGTLTNANTKFRDRYVFAGWHTRTKPFEALYNPRTGFIEDVIYYGDRGRIDRLVGDDDQLTINVSGKRLFLEQTYTRRGRVLPSHIALGFNGTLTVNEVDFLITPDMTLEDIALTLEASSEQTHVFAQIFDSRLILESATAVSEFTLSDNMDNRLLEDLGILVSGAFNIGTAAPALPFVDSTPAIFTGAGPVANLTYDITNNCMNIFLGADANGGISKAANIFITPGTYASVADLITEIQMQIDSAYGAGKILVSDAGGGVLQLETVATGDEINMGDLVIGGAFNGYPDTASDSADLNLIAVVGNAPATPAGIAGTDGNDKFIIDLGPTASKNGEDVLPQTIDLRASLIVTVGDLIDEIRYQIFQNDVLRGAVKVSLNSTGRIVFETVNQGEEVLASDFVFSEGATGTLAALGISDTPIRATVPLTGFPPAFPFLVVTGLNDTLVIDLGPSVSVDGTDPDPVTMTIAPGVYNNLNQIYNEILLQINANPVLTGALNIAIVGPDLVLSSVKTGSAVRGEDLNVTGTIVGTLGWIPGDAIAGGGTSDGRGIELEPRNIFHTLITLRDDCMGVVSKYSMLLDAQNEAGELLALSYKDIVTVKYDAGSFQFRILVTDTMEDLVNNIQEVLSTRALVELTTDGRIKLTNMETHSILDLSITAENATGQPRDLFNDIFDELPTELPGLSSATSKIMLDPRRYIRLGDEDIGLLDNDLENLLETVAVVGARANRLTNITNIFTASELNVEELRLSLEAANYAEVLTTLSQQELIMQSALGVGARVLPPSLIDFLL